MLNPFRTPVDRYRWYQDGYMARVLAVDEANLVQTAQDFLYESLPARRRNFIKVLTLGERRALLYRPGAAAVGVFDGNDDLVAHIMGLPAMDTYELVTNLSLDTVLTPDHVLAQVPALCLVNGFVVPEHQNKKLHPFILSCFRALAPHMGYSYLHYTNAMAQLPVILSGFQAGFHMSCLNTHMHLKESAVMFSVSLEQDNSAPADIAAVRSVSLSDYATLDKLFQSGYIATGFNRHTLMLDVCEPLNRGVLSTAVA